MTCCSVKMSLLIRNLNVRLIPQLTQCIPKCTTQSYSSGSNSRSGPKIVMPKDGGSILCYHPQPKFPYECSKPIPRTTSELEASDSPLKVQLKQDYMKQDEERFNVNGPSSTQLEEMFFTEKYKFRPRPAFKKRSQYKRYNVHKRDSI